MRFTVEASALTHALGLVSSCIAKRTTIPILSNIKIDAAGEFIEITGTDLYITLALKVPAKVSESGAITLPGKRLSDYARLLPSGDVEFKSGDNLWVTVKSGRTNSRIAGMEAKAFPEIPPAPGATLSVPSDVLMQLIRRTEFAISAEESRFTINAALLDCKDERLALIATDGHRMALASAPLAGSAQLKTLIPRLAMANLRRIADESKEAVQISVDENHLFFRVGHALLTARKSSGNFPDYQRALPKDQPIKTNVNRADLDAALSRVSQFSDIRSKCVKLCLKPSEIELYATTADTGESTESIACDYPGADLQVGLNSGYVLDFLRATDTESITALLINASSAVEFRPAGSDDYRVIVMPMSL